MNLILLRTTRFANLNAGDVSAPATHLDGGLALRYYDHFAMSQVSQIQTNTLAEDGAASFLFSTTQSR